VPLHLLELGRGQATRLVEDVLGHAELAGVVEERRGLDGSIVGSSSIPQEVDGRQAQERRY